MRGLLRSRFPPVQEEEEAAAAAAAAAGGGEVMSELQRSNDLDEALKPFQQRASEAEDRLARLESLLASKEDQGNTDRRDMSSIIKDFQSKLEITQAELTAEREKSSKEIQKLTTENLKLQYRITHLIRALKEVDSKLGT